MGNAQWEYTKQAQNAMSFYQRILAINPYHTNTWRNIHIILEQSKNIDYKIQAYEALLTIRKDEPKLYLNLGRAYGMGKKQPATSSQRF